MIWLDKIKAKVQGIDEFYVDIPKEHLGLYQNYFNKILNEVDLNTQTRWSAGKDFDKDQLDRDFVTMERIVIEEAIKEGLHSVILNVIVNQYFFADVYRREKDKADWVKRVIHRKSTDYFPSGWAIYNVIF